MRTGETADWVDETMFQSLTIQLEYPRHPMVFAEVLLCLNFIVTVRRRSSLQPLPRKAGVGSETPGFSQLRYLS